MVSLPIYATPPGSMPIAVLYFYKYVMPMALTQCNLSSLQRNDIFIEKYNR
jgi:hypothetical protein